MPMKDCDWKEVGTRRMLTLPAVWRGKRAGLGHGKNESQRGALGLIIGADTGGVRALKLCAPNP